MEVEKKDYDVLFGRGNGVSQHPGNRRFRDLIKAYRPLYMQAPRYSRAQIASNVIAMIQWGNPPGRFLEDIGTGYYQVASHPRILEKAMQALRGRSLDSRPSTSFLSHSASVSSESVNSREDPVETSEMALDCNRRDSSSGHTSSSFTSELNRLQANNSRHSSFEDKTK